MPDEDEAPARRTGTDLRLPEPITERDTIQDPNRRSKAKKLAVIGATGAALGLAAHLGVGPSLGSMLSGPKATTGASPAPSDPPSSNVGSIPVVDEDPEGAPPGSIWFREDLGVFRVQSDLFGVLTLATLDVAGALWAQPDATVLASLPILSAGFTHQELLGLSAGGGLVLDPDNVAGVYTSHSTLDDKSGSANFFGTVTASSYYGELDTATLGAEPFSFGVFASGQVLYFNGTDWVNEPLSDVSVTSLNGLTGAVTIRSPNSTLTVGTSGQDVNIDINLANANLWTALQTFGNNISFGGATLDVSGLSTGNVLYYDGTHWINQTPVLSLASANNGISVSDSTGDVTITLGELSYGTLDAVHFSFTALSSGQVLAYNGTDWTNVTVVSGVSSVSNSDGTLTISPTTGAVVASLNLGHANTWTATQTFGTYISFLGAQVSGSISSGEFLYFNGTNWVGQGLASGTGVSVSDYTISLSGNFVTSLTTESGGGITLTASNPTGLGAAYYTPSVSLGGDLSGSTLSSVTVVAIDGSPVSISGPSLNQVLVWNGSDWVNATVPATSGVTSLNGLTGALSVTSPNSTISVGTSGGVDVTVDIALGNANSWTALQTFGNDISFGGAQLDVTSLTTGNLLQYNGTYWVNVTPASIAVVSSVSNSDGSLTISPTTGSVVASLNVGNANSWTATQTFGNHISIGGVTFDISSLSSDEFIYYNGSNWVNASELDVFELDGATFSMGALSTNQVLVYDGSHWTNASVPATSGVTSLNSLTGALSITSPNSTLSVGTSGGVDVTVDINLGNANTWTASQTFYSGDLLVTNPAHTFSYSFVGAAISAARTITLPLLTGDDTMAVLAFAQSWTAVQTFGNNISFGGATLNVTSLTTGNILQYNGTNWVNVTAASIAVVSSVSNSDGSLTISPTTGAVVASLNVGHGNTWTALQQFTKADLALLGTSTGYTLLESGLTGGSNNTLTLPTTSSDTLAGLGTAETWTALQKFTNGDFAILGSSTGYTLLESGLSGGSNNTLTLPTSSSDTLAAIGTAQTWSALQKFTNGDLAILGSSTGYTLLESGLSGGSNNTLTLPTTATDTLAALGTAQEWTAAQTFDSSDLLVYNPGKTFKYTIVASAIGANYNLTLPPITGSDTLAALGLAQNWSGVQTFGNNISFGGATLDVTSLTSGNILQYNGTYWVNVTAASIAVVSSVSNSDGSLTISPTTGAVVASLNVGNANTWTATQTFANHISIGGATFNISALASGQLIYYNGSNWVNTSELDNFLLDGKAFSFTSLSSNQVLVYNGSNWINAAVPATAGVTSLNSLTGALSVTSPNSTLSVGTSGGIDVTVDINLSHGNTWAALQQFTNGDFAILGSSTGYTLLESGLSGGSNNTLTLPTTATDTLAGIGTAQTWTALQKFTNGDFAILGSSTGYTLLESGLSGGSNNTLTLPTTATDTIAGLGTVQEWTAAQTFDSNDLLVYNPAKTYKYTIVASAIGGNYNLTLPPITGNDTIASLGLAQNWSGVQTFGTNISFMGAQLSGSVSSSQFLYYNGSNWVATAELDNFKLDNVAFSFGSLNSGDVLSYNGSNWVNTASSGLGVKWSSLANPSTSLSLTMASADTTTFTLQQTSQTGFTWTSSTLTTGTLATFSATGTALSSTVSLVTIASSGANSNTGVVAQGLNISVTNTNGTSGTNVALYLAASGATTANTALQIHAGQMLSDAAQVWALSSNTAASLKLTDGTNAYYTLNTQTGTASTVTHTLAVGSAVTASLAAGSTFSAVKVPPFTYTDSAQTTVTALSGMGLWVDVPTVAQSGGAVTVSLASTVYIAGAPAAGSSVTLTAAYALYIAGGGTYFGGSLAFSGTSLNIGTASAYPATVYTNSVTFEGAGAALSGTYEISGTPTVYATLAFNGTSLSIGSAAAYPATVYANSLTLEGTPSIAWSGTAGNIGSSSNYPAIVYTNSVTFEGATAALSGTYEIAGTPTVYSTLAFNGTSLNIGSSSNYPATIYGNSLTFEGGSAGIAGTYNIGGTPTVASSIAVSGTSLTLGGAAAYFGTIYGNTITLEGTPAINFTGTSGTIGSASAYPGTVYANTIDLEGTPAINWTGTSGTFGSVSAYPASVYAGTYYGELDTAKLDNVTFSFGSLSSGDVLSYNGSNWVNTASSGLGVKWSSLANPSTSLSLTMGASDTTTFTLQQTSATGFTWTTSTLTTGVIASFASTGTALSGTVNLVSIASSGANGNTGVTVEGLNIAVTNTNGTSGTNVALYLAASGATTGNTALQIHAGQILSDAAQVWALPSNTAAALKKTDGTNAYYTLNTQTGTVSTVTHTFAVGSAITAALAAGSTFSMVSLSNFTYTDSATTTVTALNGLMLNVGTPTINQSGGAVTVTTASTVYIAAAPAAGSSVTITNAYSLYVAGGTTYFGGSIAFNGTSLNVGSSSAYPANIYGNLLTFEGASAGLAGTYNIGGTPTVTASLAWSGTSLNFGSSSNYPANLYGNLFTFEGASAGLAGTYNIGGTPTVTASTLAWNGTSGVIGAAGAYPGTIYSNTITLEGTPAINYTGTSGTFASASAYPANLYGNLFTFEGSSAGLAGTYNIGGTPTVTSSVAVNGTSLTLGGAAAYFGTIYGNTITLEGTPAVNFTGTSGTIGSASAYPGTIYGNTITLEGTPTINFTGTAGTFGSASAYPGNLYGNLFTFEGSSAGLAGTYSIGGTPTVTASLAWNGTSLNFGTSSAYPANLYGNLFTFEGSSAGLAGTYNIGGTPTLTATLTFSAAQIFAAKANTALAFKLTDGTNAYYTLNTQTGTVSTVTHTFNVGSAITAALAAGSTFSMVSLGSFTYTDSATTTVTALQGLMLNVAQPTINQSGGAVTITTASSVYITGAPAAGSSVTITNAYSLYVNAGTAYFGGGVSGSGNLGALTAGTGILNTGNNWTATQTFGNNISFGGATLNVTSLTSGNILQYNGSNWVNVTTSSIAVVSSVSNSDGTLTISPTTGAVVASLNLGNANTWTAAQTISYAGGSQTFFTVNDTSASADTLVLIEATGIGGGSTFLSIQKIGSGAFTALTIKGNAAVTTRYNTLDNGSTGAATFASSVGAVSYTGEIDGTTLDGVAFSFSSLSSGQALVYNGSNWINSGVTASSLAWSALTNPSASLSLTMGAADTTTFTLQQTSGTGFTWTTSTLTTGVIAALASTGTALSGTVSLVTIASTGANSNAAVTAQGLNISVGNTNGTSGTNVGLYLNASGATTNNWALQIAGGNIYTSSGAATYWLLSTGIDSAIEFWDGTTNYYKINTTTNSGSMAVHGFNATGPTFVGGAGLSWHLLNLNAITITLTGTTTTGALHGIQFNVPVPTITDSSSITVTNTSTVYIAGAPTNAGSVTITNAYALYVLAGLSYFGGGISGSGDTGALTAGSGILNTGNSWTAVQTFGTNLSFLGAQVSGSLTSGGLLYYNGSNWVDATDLTYSSPTLTLGGTSATIVLQGSSTGTWTLATATGSATSYTITFPAANITVNRWSGLSAPTATLSLTFPAADTTTFTFSATSQTAWTDTSSTLTSGMLHKWSLTGTSAAVTAANSGTLATFSATNTGWTAATQTLVGIYASGANTNSGVTVQGLAVSVTNTNATSGTNTALYLTASGATTANYALYINGGTAYFGGASTFNALATFGNNISFGGVTVNVSSIATGNVLYYNGTNWINLNLTSPNSTITITGSSTVHGVDINLAHANTWTATQTIQPSSAGSAFVVKGTSNTNLSVNTSTGAVGTYNNTLDDGSGNMIVNGGLTLGLVTPAITFSNSNAGEVFGLTGALTSTKAFEIKASDNSNAIALALSTAAVTLSSTSYTLSVKATSNTSDSRLKPDFQPYTGNPLDELRAARFGMHSQWADSLGGPAVSSLGRFQAAVAAETLPPTVTETTPEGVFTVINPAYQHWIVGVMKAQQMEIDTLKAELQKLREAATRTPRRKRVHNAS